MGRFLSIFPPLVLALFLFLTLLVEAPLIAFPSWAGEAYQGINIAHFGNDEHHYLSRGKEVLEGNSLGQMYLKDWKDEQDPFFSDIEHIALFPFALSPFADDINIVTLYNILNGIGVFVLLLLVYYFALQLSKQTLLAAATATFLVSGYVDVR